MGNEASSMAHHAHGTWWTISTEQPQDSCCKTSTVEPSTHGVAAPVPVGLTIEPVLYLANRQTHGQTLRVQHWGCPPQLLRLKPCCPVFVSSIQSLPIESQLHDPYRVHPDESYQRGSKTDQDGPNEPDDRNMPHSTSLASSRQDSARRLQFCFS